MQHCQSPTVPLPEACADMLWSNLGLLAAEQILPVLHNWARALKTDGLLFFTCFGRDTLAELKSRLKENGIESRSVMFPDMHDLGDMLAENGFYDPVTDTAKLVLDYKKAETFWADMDTLGVWRAVAWDDENAARSCVGAIFEREGGLGITLETVYGHAVKNWCCRRGERGAFFPKR